MKFFVLTYLTLINAAYATSVAPGTFNAQCIHCMYYQQSMIQNPYMNTGFMPIYNYYTPWWNPYSMQRYPNYNTPAPWMNYGMNGSHYPSHHGGGMAGKPNVYIYGKAGTKFNLTFEFSEKSLMLSTVPKYDKKWEGVVTGDGIVSNDAFYRYFYYDYGLDIKKLQWKRGSCVSENKLMEYLNKKLLESRFHQREIHDFNEFWSFKIPEAKRYCIYPQGNKELNQVAKINISPKADINRLTFLIVPQKNIPKESGRPFIKPPVTKWKPELIKKENEILINEWGVAWLDESEVKD